MVNRHAGVLLLADSARLRAGMRQDKPKPIALEGQLSAYSVTAAASHALEH